MSGELRPHHLERMVDLHERQLRSWSEVQGALAEVTQGKTIAILDNTTQGYGNVIDDGLKSLEQHGGAVGERYARYIFTELLGERLPRQANEIFQRFLGKDVNLQNIRANDFTTLPSDISAVILSGSAAQVSKALNYPQASTRLFQEDIDHQGQYRTNQAVIAEAQRLKIPLIGICYGHQVLADAMGAKVESFGQGPIVAQIGSKATVYGAELLVGALGYAQAPEQLVGDVPVYHDDYVWDLSDRSALIMRAEMSGVIHAVLHAQNAHFTGDAQHDAQHMRDIIDGGQGTMLGLQFHPELDPYMPLVEFIFDATNQRPSTHMFERDVQPISHHMITLMQHFLGAHQSFKK